MKHIYINVFEIAEFRIKVNFQTFIILNLENINFRT